MKQDAKVGLLNMGTLISKQENMRKPLVRLGVDILFFILLITPTWLFNLTDIPTVNRRGFYCSDNGIRYPYRSNTLPSLTLFLVGLPLVIAAALIIEAAYFKYMPPTRKRGVFHPLLVALYRLFGFFIVGANINQFLTDAVKNSVGRLRPYFLDFCQPNVDCNVTNEHTYILEYECTRTAYPGMSDEDFHSLATDVRKSFPSGHASFAMYCAVFGLLYLELRLKWREARMFKICLQAGTLVAGVWACCTRYIDNKHHPGDIVGGALFGGGVAVMMMYFYYRSLTYTDRKDRRTMCSVAPASDATGSSSLQMEPETNGNHDVAVTVDDGVTDKNGTSEM